MSKKRPPRGLVTERTLRSMIEGLQKCCERTRTLP